MRDLTKEKITESLASYKIQQHQRYPDLFLAEKDNKFRQAAVIIPLLEIEQSWHVLLTRRSQDLIEHRGQVAYPGGAWEKGDEDLQATALREMHEEIGVHPRDVKVLGDLGDMPIITRYMVRLFVGQIPWPYKLEINKYEVESAFIVPLHWLADRHHRRLEYRSYAGREIPVIFFEHFDGHQLWGASAEMTLALLEALGLED